MARLRLTLHDITCSMDEEGKIEKKALSVSTESETASAFFQVDNAKYGYKLTLVDFSFKKKMYQPTEIQAEIQITMLAGDTATFVSIDKKTLVDLFKDKKVSLEEMNPKTSDKSNNVKFTIGTDFYVDEVQPRYKPTSLFVKLKIYSLDNLMTRQHYSRSFVSQKLFGQIVENNLKSYPIPYKTDECLSMDYDKAKQLFYEGTENGKKVKKEHIFPYLVQYNESFYDFVARTANRWGEFMYYENGNLQFGYDDAAATVKTIDSGYSNITYVDLDTPSDNVPKDQNYNYEGSEEKGFLDTTLRKSPNSISGTLFWPTKSKWDKVLMKEITSFLKNDKNVPTWVGNRLFENTWDLAMKALETKTGNYEFNKAYFPDEDKPASADHYGTYNFGDDKDKDEDDGYNLFSEINSKYNAKEYAKILKEEFKAAKDAICIDFNTTCPDLSLGSVIKVKNEDYIVVEIASRIDEDLDYSFNKKTETVERVVTKALVFHVIATAKGTEKFYPTVLPSGHVRQASPQTATVTTADDPDGKNRVRVMFDGWQKVKYNNDDKDDGITDDTKALSSPWLTFATAGSGSQVIGKHYEGDKVLIGFIDGNIERPYVLGGVAKKGNSNDYTQQTPGGREFNMYDDEDGVKSFMTGLFMPCVGTLSPFFSAIPGFSNVSDWFLKPARGYKNNTAMGGGFEIKDKYGIYKISGSTDGREVAIASPWGEVNVNAFTGINISAPNGDISIKGKNVKIEAGNNLELISGTNVKNKILGEGGLSGFGADVAAAVAKKLANKASNIIDLSTVRAAIEIVFRPAEGALRIKSNRFLMLEAGKGQCTYPKDAYASEATYNENFEELKKTDFRKGLKLASGVKELLKQIKVVGDTFDADYRNAYNKCYSKRVAFENKLKEAKILKLRKEYKATDENTHKICNEFKDLVNDFWADGTDLLTEDKLGFVDEYKLDASTVTDNNILSLKGSIIIAALPANTLKAYKDDVVSERAKYRKEILTVANELRQAIIDFRKACELTEEYVTEKISTIRDKNVPKGAKKCLIDAYKKENLVDGDDVYYFKSLTEDQKKLGSVLTVAGTETHKVVLERKAAILTIEGLGFKDEWRKEIPNPAPVGAGAVPAPGAPIPTKKVERKFKAADLTTEYWQDYVTSLVAVPKLKPLELKAFKEFKKACLDNLDDQNPLNLSKSWQENDSWSDAKKGAILFSSDYNIYNLKKNIEDVPSPFKENLTKEDDTDNDVSTMLDNVKNILSGI